MGFSKSVICLLSPSVNFNGFHQGSFCLACSFHTSSWIPGLRIIPPPETNASTCLSIAQRLSCVWVLWDLCLIAPFPFTVQFNYTKKQQLTAEFTHEVILKGAIVEKTSCIHRIPQGCWGPCLWPWLQDGSLNKPSHIVRKYSSTYYVPPSTTTPPAR